MSELEYTGRRASACNSSATMEERLTAADEEEEANVNERVGKG